MFSRQKGISSIAIILLIILVSLAGYTIYKNPQLLSKKGADPSPSPNTSDETADWKTYSNTKYGYSLKYPDYLQLIGSAKRIGDLSDKTAVPLVIFKQGDPKDYLEPVIIDVTPMFFRDYNKTLSEVAQANFEANKNEDSKVISSLKETTLDGRPAYTYTILSNGFSTQSGGQLVTSSQKPEHLVIVELQNKDDYLHIVYFDQPTFRTILSTFKFTD